MYGCRSASVSSLHLWPNMRLISELCKVGSSTESLRRCIYKFHSTTSCQYFLYCHKQHSTAVNELALENTCQLVVNSATYIQHNYMVYCIIQVHIMQATAHFSTWINTTSACRWRFWVVPQNSPTNQIAVSQVLSCGLDWTIRNVWLKTWE